MSRVLMLVINPMTADTRVDKEAAALTAAGHDVTVAARADPGLPQEEVRNGYTILRLPYRRVVKDRIVGARVRAAWEHTQRRHALLAACTHGTATPAGQTVTRLLLVAERVRRLRGVVAWSVGGSYLKALRSRILPREYWAGTVSALATRLECCDVIHAHDLGTLAAAVRLARRWAAEDRERPRPRVVYDSHELYVEQLTRWRPLEKLLWRLHETRWIRHADLVITVSDGIAAELRRRYRLASRPLVVLNTPPRSAAQPDAADVRTDSGVPTDRILAVYVGTVKQGRGVDRLIPALATDLSWDLVLVGPGAPGEVESIHAAASALGVQHRVHVLPGVPAARLPGYIATADVGVHPLERSCLNHDLALPNKLFDYVFASLPVAVSDLTEMRGLVEAHDLGTVFDPAEPDDVAQAIIGAAAQRTALRRRELDPVLDPLCWETQAGRLVRAYDRLLDGV